MADEAVFTPMRAEMERSLSRLHQDSFGPPYFLAYRLVDERRYYVSASRGAVVSEGEDDFRTLFVEARFGSRALDNTELNFSGWNGPAARDPEALRHNIWRLTDDAYKNAVAGFLEKKAKRATEYVPEVLDDFSVEPSTAYAAPAARSEFDYAQARGLTRRLSAVFKRHPDVYDGRVTITLKSARRFLVTSEGTRLATDEENVPSVLQIFAMTRAADGMRLDAQQGWPVRRLSELPSEWELAAEIEVLARQLEDGRRAAIQEPMAAPAILDPEFTGVLFHEALGHKLEGQRQRDPQQSQLFKDLVGKKVIPEYISLWDDPTLREFEGLPLHGYYEFDSEGVDAQKVVLVDKGILRNFLMSRWPIKGFARSNGHGRAAPSLRPVGRMSNLIVKAEEPVARPQLSQRLLELVRRAKKPYAFLLVGAFGGENPNTREVAQTLEVRPRLIFRVDAKTGAQTLVRGVSLVGTPIEILNRIVAVGDDPALSNSFVCGAESGFVPVAQIAPSVLVSDVELQRLPEDRSRPPILDPPAYE